MLQLYVEAPFATFRTFTAGWYRPTATFITPSAAYGLLLNVAGIESRLPEGRPGHDGKTPASLTALDLPEVEIAIGAPTFRIRGQRLIPLADDEDPFPRVQSAFQQLHNYPVGASGADRAESTKGNKYNITPVRREFLSEFRAVIALRGNDDLADRIRRGLNGELEQRRYGIPFLGDNAFLIDRLVVLEDPLLFDKPPETRWYEPIVAEAAGLRERTARLTVLIDRADLSRTTSQLYSPGSPLREPSSSGWTRITPPRPQPKPAARSRKS